MTQSHMAREVAEIPRAAAHFLDQSAEAVAKAAAAIRARDPAMVMTVAVTNHADSPMATASAHCLTLCAGEEKSVAATKTYVSSVLAGLALLAEWQEDAALPQLCTTAERLAAQGADVFVTGADAPGARRLPMVTGLHPLVAPLVGIAAFYAFVEKLARRRGFDPDTPPHLRKVTETV